MPELSGDQIDALLERWPVARLATVGEGGRPHLVPVVFARSDGALWTPVDGKPKAGRTLARVRHLERDPRVTLLLDRYAADWRRLWWIRLEGRAALHRGEGASEVRAARALREKYPQYRETPLFRGEPLLIRIDIGRRTGWCADASEPVAE